MEINVDITRNDYADFNLYYFYKKAIWKRVKIVIVAAISIPLILNIGNPFHLGIYLISVLLTGLIFAAIYLGLGLYAIKRTGKIPLEGGSVLGKRKFIISDEGLIEEGENNRNLQKWVGIKSVEENKNSVFIFVDKMAAYIIPKRFFLNEEQINEFKSLIGVKINV